MKYGFPNNFYWGAARPYKMGEARPEKLYFPKGFFFGAATSAHQVEGNNFNDWSKWEEQIAKSKEQIARKQKRPDIVLDKYPNPLQEENYISGRACDHYNRFREDFDIVKSIGHNAHRFSIEWSRIEIEEGKFEMETLRHYEQVVKALRERNIEPFVTLWHWTLPRWLADKGGVEHEKFPEYFTRYAEHVARWFEKTSAKVTFWITINEPMVWTSHAYLRGNWPPQVKSFSRYKKAIDRLAEAHRRSYATIHKAIPEAQVGIAKNIPGFLSGLIFLLFVIARPKGQIVGFCTC